MAEAGDALWNDLPFVKNDTIVTYEMEMTYGSPSGQLAFLEVVAGALTRDREHDAAGLACLPGAGAPAAS